MTALIDMMRQAAEAEAKKEKPRGYIGASGVGAECDKKALFTHRWAATEEFSADTLWRFADGHLSEDVVAARIKAIPGVELFTHKANGEQFGFADLGGHLRGHIDGVIKGHPEIEGPAIWEHKAVNEKKFRAFGRLKEKRRHEDVLYAFDETYYGQAMLYCHKFDMDEHYLTVSTPGARQIDDVITPANPAYAVSLIDKARAVLTTRELPRRINDDPKFFKCSWCAFNSICHRQGEDDPILLVNQNCRTCKFAEPILDGEDGGWRCTAHGVELTEQGQREGCEDWANAWLS